MTILDWKERPFVSLEQMAIYKSKDQETTQKYGPIVRAIQISNRDYGYRYEKFSETQRMQNPPSAWKHIFLGYLVIRKLNTPNQYETWMSEDVFEEIYELSN